MECTCHRKSNTNLENEILILEMSMKLPSRNPSQQSMSPKSIEQCQEKHKLTKRKLHPWNNDTWSNRSLWVISLKMESRHCHAIGTLQSKLSPNKAAWLATAVGKQEPAIYLNDHSAWGPSQAACRCQCHQQSSE